MGVGAVEAVELGEVVSILVGEEALVAPAVGVDQAELKRNAIKKLEDKVGKWKREELTNLYRRARESRIRESLLPVEPFDCDDLGVVSTLAGVGLTLANAPLGVALIIGGAGAGSTVASKAGVCSCARQETTQRPAREPAACLRLFWSLT